MIIESQIKQGSEEWFSARLGVVSASCFGEIFTPGGKEATGAKVENYANKLIAETVTGNREDGYQSQAMDRGNVIEPDARNWYAMAKGVDVSQVGLVYRDGNKAVSCSPDGLIMDGDSIKYGLEIKCPLAHTQIKYLMAGVLPPIYKPQVQGSMWVCEVDRWDFLSYHPAIPSLLISVYRDEEFLEKFEPVLFEFIKKITQQKKLIEER